MHALQALSRIFLPEWDSLAPGRACVVLAGRVFVLAIRERKNRITMPRIIIEERDEKTKPYRPLGRDQAKAAVYGASALAIGRDADARHASTAAAYQQGRARRYVHRPLVISGAGGGTESTL
jgi:hypothetical protein